MNKKGINFTAIDFETANYRPTSACSVGLAIVRRGKVTETFTALIRPAPFRFLRKFVDIHGIRPKDAASAPTFRELWPEIKKRIKGLPLLAHNATFDRNVLKACLKFYGIRFREPEFACTLRMSRDAWPKMRHHKLSTLCRKFKIPLKHHEAGSDALACARIALKICEKKRVTYFSRKCSSKNDFPPLTTPGVVQREGFSAHLSNLT